MPSSSSSRRRPARRPPTAPSEGAERGSRVGEQRRERHVRLEEQPCRGTQSAPLELLGHASRRIDPHVTLARRRASASPAAWVSDAFAVATTIDSGNGGRSLAGQLVEQDLGRVGGTEDAVLGPDQRERHAAQLKRHRKRERRSDGGDETLPIADPIVAHADRVNDVGGREGTRLGCRGLPGAQRPLVDGRALDRFTAVAPHGCRGPGGHEQGFVGSDDERVDLELRDLPLPDVDLDRSCHDVPSYPDRRRGQSTPRCSRGRRPRSAVVTS